MAKAPEKIYIRVKHDKVLKEWNNVLKGVHDIEYIRTDAFIEKAIGWIDYNNRNGGCYYNEWEKNFKDYMEGD